MIYVILFAVLALFLVLVGIGYYNAFVARRNAVEQAFSTIDVMLQKRFDLVPNLVATVQQYMRHEGDTLTRIAELRGRAADERADSDSRVQAANAMNRLIGGIMLQVENYPELKANANFTELQQSLEGMEEQIAAARRAFNAAVTLFNNSVEMFPGNIVAGLFGFRRRTLLETPEAERKNPDVKSLFSR